MKMAILYSGSIRTLAETINNNLDYFNNYDIDLYFSVWDHVGYSDRINSPDYIMSKRIINTDTKITKELITSLIPKDISIKTIKIEKYNSNAYALNLINGVDNSGLHAQYYKILDCFNLLDNSINYDMIARFRCDIILNNKIEKHYLQNIISNNYILFPNKIWYDHIWQENSRSINEMIWISNIALMKKACNIYNNTNNINKIIKNNNQAGTNYGESITFMNLLAENMIGNIKTFDFDYNILR